VVLLELTILKSLGLLVGIRGQGFQGPKVQGKGRIIQNYD